MKRWRWILNVMAAGMMGLGTTGAQEGEDGSVRLASDYRLSEPFEPKELRQIAEKKERDGEDSRRMMFLLLRAGLEKDNSFKNLLDQPELRAERNVDLALSAYDFHVNRSGAALDRILAQLAVEPTGADVDTIVVLATLDEWDRSVRAFRKHFVHTDGAGGDCMRGFLRVRAGLYPEEYKKSKEMLETPIAWPDRMLERR